MIKLLLVATTTSFLCFGMPVYGDTTFPAAICVVQKGVTAEGAYIIFYSNNTRTIVTKAVYDATNVGDCTWD